MKPILLALSLLLGLEIQAQLACNFYGHPFEKIDMYRSLEGWTRISHDTLLTGEHIAVYQNPKFSDMKFYYHFDKDAICREMTIKTNAFYRSTYQKMYDDDDHFKKISVDHWITDYCSVEILNDTELGMILVKYSTF